MIIVINISSICLLTNAFEPSECRKGVFYHFSSFREFFIHKEVANLKSLPAIALTLPIKAGAQQRQKEIVRTTYPITSCTGKSYCCQLFTVLYPGAYRVMWEPYHRVISRVVDDSHSNPILLAELTHPDQSIGRVMLYCPAALRFCYRTGVQSSQEYLTIRVDVHSDADRHSVQTILLIQKQHKKDVAAMCVYIYTLTTYKLIWWEI